MQLRAESGCLLFFIPLMALDTLPAQPALIKAPGPAQGPGEVSFLRGATPAPMPKRNTRTLRFLPASHWPWPRYITAAGRGQLVVRAERR